MSEASKQAQPLVTGSQVLAAGLASATAAVITSRFGVAGTLLGAALTSMIITGGSAILKSYLESVTGSVRKVPRKMRAKANRAQAGRAEAPNPATIPGRPDLRENFMGRMRAAMGWFSHLPTLRRRSIMVRGFVAAAAAFVIGMGAITAVEAGVLGNSLSCGIWSTCQTGQTPGIGGGSATGGGGGSTLSGLVSGGPVTDPAADPAQDSATPVDPATGEQPVDPATGEQPVDPNTGEPVAPETPVEEPAVDPAAPAAPSETPQAPASSGTEEPAPVE